MNFFRIDLEKRHDEEGKYSILAPPSHVPIAASKTDPGQFSKHKIQNREPCPPKGFSWLKGEAGLGKSALAEYYHRWYLKETGAFPQQACGEYYSPNLRALKIREIPGMVNGVAVNALPDTGSSFDIISESFAKQHGMKIESTTALTIHLPGGIVSKSTARVLGHFRFRGEDDVYLRYFHVLRNSVYDMVLGREFLNETMTMTDHRHRIIEKARPCLQKGSRLFLMGEPPEGDILRCKVNGVQTSALPDTGSDLMVISGDFARRNKFKVERGKEYRRQVELMDGSVIWTDGMVLGAELAFEDLPRSSMKMIDHDSYIGYARRLLELLDTQHDGKAGKSTEATFICDLHVIEDLPCDLILSSDFIFDNDLFSRLNAEGGLNNSLLFMRLKKARAWWFSRRHPSAAELPLNTPESIPLETARGTTWNDLWEDEERLRNQTQLWISQLREPLKSEEQRAENQRQREWDRSHPRPISGVIVTAIPIPSRAG